VVEGRELDGARVLVTGGCGLVGSRIGQVLANSGAVGIALDNLDAYPFDYARRFGATDVYDTVVRGDVTDADAVRRAADGVDYVIHAAAYADVAACSGEPFRSTWANVVGTQRVLEAVRRERPRRFVFVSSASVYGNGPAAGTEQQWSERTPLEPISVYANAKVWGEHQTRLELDHAGVEHVALRYFSVYGEPQMPKRGSHSWCVAWFAARAIAGLPLVLRHGGRQLRDFVHVDDIAEATVRALVGPDAAGHVVNVGTGIGTTVEEVARAVVEELPDAPLVSEPGRPDDPLGGYADTTLMQRSLNFKPAVCLRDGIRRYARWLRTDGWMAAHARTLAHEWR
jgi:nucleoside-diphosphate-sugar epimerase